MTLQEKYQLIFGEDVVASKNQAYHELALNLLYNQVDEDINKIVRKHGKPKEIVARNKYTYRVLFASSTAFRNKQGMTPIVYEPDLSILTKEEYYNGIDHVADAIVRSVK